MGHDGSLEGLAAILPADQWNLLVANGVSRVFAPGQTLMRQGEQATHVLLVLAGRLKVSRVDVEGNTVVLAVRGAGELLGELGLFDPDRRRSATATAIDRCATRVLPTERFTAVSQQLGLQERLLSHVTRRLQEAEEVRAELSVLPAGPRIARCLLRFSAEGGGPSLASAGAGAGPPPLVDIGLNQTELGQAAGLHRSTVALELRKLRAEGLVTTSRGHVVIVGVERLRSWAEQQQIAD